MATVTFEKAQRAGTPARTPPRSRLDRRSGTASSWCSSARPAAASPPPSGCSRAWRDQRRQDLIGDRDVAHTAPKDRDIAMVFQNYALYPT